MKQSTDTLSKWHLLWGNFTNIRYSLSLRHQLYQCYVNLATDDLPEEKLEVGQSMYCSCLKYYLIIIYSWKYFLEFYFHCNST